MEFIYSTINKELTQENKNPIQYFFNEKHPLLSNYYNTFFKNNNSKISDLFIGHYVTQTICQNCNGKIHKYNFFYYLNFNSKNISIYYTNINPIEKSCINLNNNFMINAMQMNNMCINPMQMSFNNFQKNNNMNQNINIMDYFKYVIPKCYNKTFQNYCNNCCMNTYYNEIFNIYSLPSILTIELSNNENCNFILQDELDLQNCTVYYPEKSEGIYKLISILCQISYNEKFICYCFNSNKNLWYSYTDGKINEVEKMDISAIPLLAFYQCKNKIKEYKNIKRDDTDKICLNIKVANIKTKKLFFNKNNTIQDLIQYISSNFNIGNISKLLINGEQVNNNQILSDIPSNNSGVLDILIILKE